MIHNKSVLVFGTGDIRVTAGTRTEDSRGFLFFKQEPFSREIGFEEECIYENIEDAINKSDVVFSFSKIESVVVVRDKLNELIEMYQEITNGISENIYKEKENE